MKKKKEKRNQQMQKMHIRSDTTHDLNVKYSSMVFSFDCYFNDMLSCLVPYGCTLSFDPVSQWEREVELEVICVNNI